MSLQLSIVNALALPAPPQVVPSSVSVTEPDPCVAPKPDPLIVTCCPAAAVPGLSDSATGGLSGWVDVPTAKMCSSPCVAPDGSVTVDSVFDGSTGTAA